MRKVEDWVPKRIEELCREKHMSYYRLSELSGVSRGAISLAVNGKSVPSMQVLEQLCEAWGITMAQFCAEEKEQPLSPLDKKLLHWFHRLTKIEQSSMASIFERADRGW